MHKKEIEEMLSTFGFVESMNKPLSGRKTTHVIHRCDKPKKLVEYYIDQMDMINRIWAFNVLEECLLLFENPNDLKNWLEK